MWIGPLLVEELKRIVRESEVTKEDDATWPKKNIVGKQELEIRVDNEHISFEVSWHIHPPLLPSPTPWPCLVYPISPHLG